jgi:hypothetical protein
MRSPANLVLYMHWCLYVQMLSRPPMFCPCFNTSSVSDMFSISCMLGKFSHVRNPRNLKKSLHGHTQDLRKRHTWYWLNNGSTNLIPLNRILERPKFIQRRNFPPFLEAKIHFHVYVISTLALLLYQMNPGHTFPPLSLRWILIFFSRLCLIFQNSPSL